MRIGRITRKLLMNWYALGFTAIFTLGLTGAAGLQPVARLLFKKIRPSRLCLFLCLSRRKGNCACPCPRWRHQNWTEALPASHAFTSSFVYPQTIEREAFAVQVGPKSDKRRAWQ